MARKQNYVILILKLLKDVEIRFVGLNYVLNRQLLKGKTKKIIGLIKDEIGGKTMTKFYPTVKFPRQYWR